MNKLGLLINNLHDLYHTGATEDRMVALSLEILTELTTPRTNKASEEEEKVMITTVDIVEHSKVSVALTVQETEEQIVANLLAEIIEEPIVETKLAEILHQQESDPFHIKEIVQKLNEAPILPFDMLIKSDSNKDTATTDEKHILELKDSYVTQEETLNDKLKEEHDDLNHQLHQEPIKDIKRALNFNEKYVFINELFRGDDVMFERSLKTINSFTIYPEAQYWIQRELKVKLGWNEGSTTVQNFDSLVKRRFAS